MMVEILIATLACAAALVGWKGVTQAEWRMLRLIMAAFVLVISAETFFDAIIRASTSPVDIGEARKVGWLPITAAIIALWFAPKWWKPRIKQG